MQRATISNDKCTGETPAATCSYTEDGEEAEYRLFSDTPQNEFVSLIFGTFRASCTHEDGLAESGCQNNSKCTSNSCVNNICQ